MLKFKYLKETIAVFISNTISDTKMSFEIKHTIKHNFRLKLGNLKHIELQLNLPEKKCVNEDRYMVPKYKVQQPEFFVILGHFLPFQVQDKPENQNCEKLKRIPGDIIILQLCTINDNYISHGPNYHITFCNTFKVLEYLRKCNIFHLINGPHVKFGIFD